ncbi:GGDEF domain-containing protein [Allorhizobium sp. BGMRC 0089]|uniref:GGDEF domain-containing protein n=1 Tax=Allorhizobium sonneratiae TaxID=2934936 RepID=UPI0020345947|nr:GGDEF domain-containing protein [Allorhizobium sonneratiae]MCM2292158.1 GGDEF domain-containing protein [Allorhizobium sonneratiae]
MLFPGIAESFAFRASVHEVASFLGFALLAYTIVTSQFGTRKYRHILAGLWFTQSLNCLLVAAILLQRQPKDMTFIPYSAFFGVIGVFCLMSVLIVMFKIVMDQNHSLLETLSRTDPLTGTLNRRGLQDAMVKLSQKARKDELLALLVFDLDYFKNINDNFGHQAGDTVLQSFAGMCSSIVMTHGLFARTGGEEFSAVLRVTDLRQAAAIAEQVRHMIATTPIVTDRGVVRLTTSIGISGLAPAAFDYDRLMRDADNALYKAKTEGRNKIGICRNGQIFCITRTEERGTPDAIDTEADRQVAALRRLSHRASPATE